MALTVLITHQDGSVSRCGADEPDAAWVPLSITFESQCPGGDKAASFNLARRIDEDVPLRLLDEVEIIDEHGQTLYGGRIVQLPRQHGDSFLLGVQCLGWASLLSDNVGFREIYRDTDLSNWIGASAQRRINLIASSGMPQDGQVAVDATTGTPRIALEINGPAWGATAKPFREAWYNANGISIGSLYWSYNKTTTIALPDAGWVFDAYLSSDDVATATTSAGITEGTSGSGTLTGGSTYKFALLQLAYNTGPAGTDNLLYGLYWDHPAVYGNHGLTLRGTEPNAGFYIEDILADALSRACPKLDFTTGPGGTIESTGVIVPQADYRDAMSAEPVILDVNKYVIWDWLVFNKTFHYRPTDPDRLTWEARMDQGTFMDLEGDDAERAINGMVVKYTDPAGTQKIAGPVGSGFDTESALLQDTSSENTVNAHGYERRWGEQTVSFPLGDSSYAVTIGTAYLYQTSLPSRSGSFTLPPQVEHPTMGLRPSREVKAGEWVRISDHPADVPRRIIAVRHDDDSGKTSVSVGNDINKVEAMLEMVGVHTKVALG